MAARHYRLDRLHVYAMPFAAIANEPAPGPEAIEHVWIADEAGLHAIGAAAAADGYDHRPQQVRRLLARGAHLCAALLDGAPAGWCLYQPVRQTTFQWLHFRGGEDWMFRFGEYVRPIHRGRRIGPGMLSHAARRFAAEGYRHNASVVAMGNRASIRSHGFVGARRIGWIVGLRLTSGRGVVVSDRGVTAGRFDAKRPCVYTCRP